MSDFPASWKFNEDGPTITGSYVETTQAPADYGAVPIITLDVDGEQRAIWVSHQVLRNRIADELATRVSGDFDEGETITITYTGKQRSESSGREYHSYVVAFGNRRKRSAADIFGASTLDVPAAAAAQPALVTGSDDDIPF